MKEISFRLNKDNEKELNALGVSALILFGSRAQGLANQKSDADVGVLVNDYQILRSEDKRRKVYDYIYDFISSQINELADVDIVFLENAPAELQAHVMKYGQIIFERAPHVFANYKAQTIEMYADFEPLRQIFHKGILSQIK